MITRHLQKVIGIWTRASAKSRFLWLATATVAAAALVALPTFRKIVFTLTAFGLYMTAFITLIVWLDSGQNRALRTVIGGTIAAAAAWDIWAHGSQALVAQMLRSMLSSGSGPTCPYGAPAC